MTKPTLLLLVLVIAISACCKRPEGMTDKEWKEKRAGVRCVAGYKFYRNQQIMDSTGHGVACEP